MEFPRCASSSLGGWAPKDERHPQGQPNTGEANADRKQKERLTQHTPGIHPGTDALEGQHTAERTAQRQQRKESQGAFHGRSSCIRAWVRASSQRVVAMP